MSKPRAYADLKAKIREYQDKDGNTKSVYNDVGTLFASDNFNHMYIVIDSIPVSPKWSGIVSVFPKEKQAEGQSGYERAKQAREKLSGSDAQVDEPVDTEKPIDLSDIPF